MAQLYFYEYDSEAQMNAVVWFIRGAFTGQRLGTFMKISEKDITVVDGVEMISLKSNKTEDRAAIPLHPILKDALRREAYKVSEQKLRENLKRAAEVAGLTQEVRLNGEEYRICDKIGTHTARRSFVSNLILAGVARGTIMKLVGWKSEREFNKYDKITKEMTAVMISKNSFFQE